MTCYEPALERFTEYLEKHNVEYQTFTHDDRNNYVYFATHDATYLVLARNGIKGGINGEICIPLSLIDGLRNYKYPQIMYVTKAGAMTISINDFVKYSRKDYHKEERNCAFLYSPVKAFKGFKLE